MGQGKDSGGGLWGHSSPTGGMEYIIFSTPEPKQLDLMTYLTTNNIGWKPLLGKWKNTYELSFIINYQYFRKHIEQNGFVDDEEEILLLGKMNARDVRPATMINMDTKTKENIGMFKEISRSDIDNHDAWSYDPYQDKFYAVM